MTDEQSERDTSRGRRETSSRPVEPEEAPQYGVGPFSVRELALVGVWLVAFVVSFFSIASQQAMAQLLFGGSVWTTGLDWILTIGVPTVAVFLIVLRRFSPDGIRRVGSLGIDQFASVAFSVSAVVWLTLLWRNVAVAIDDAASGSTAGSSGSSSSSCSPASSSPWSRPSSRSFAEDFQGRREILAHRNARPVRPVSPRPPRPARPAEDDAQADTAATPRRSPPARTRRRAVGHVPGPLRRAGRTASPLAAEQRRVGAAHARDTFEPVDAARPSRSASTSRRSGRSRRRSATWSTSAASRSSASAPPRGPS